MRVLGIRGSGAACCLGALYGGIHEALVRFHSSSRPVRIGRGFTLVENAAGGVDYVENLEGITWGPVLENGNRSLVLVSDNNFGDTQITQFFAIEVTA